MARARRSAAILCAAAAWAAAPGPARGQADPAAEARQDGYKQHMSNGVKLFQDRNFSAAIAEFDAAYALRPNANPLVNVALCHKALFDYPRAIDALERAITAHGDGMTPEDRRAAEAAIAEMRGLLAFVTVRIEPEGATLLVDGERRAAGTWKNPVALGPGAHRIGAEAEGYAPAEEKITVVSGAADRVVSLRLSPDRGRVVITAIDPGTAIAIDRAHSGSGAWEGYLGPGAHVVQFWKDGKLARETEILVVAGKEQRVREADLPAQQPAAAGAAAPQPPAAPEPPPMRGPYALASVVVFVPLAQIRNSLERTAGAGANVRLGYRFNDVLGTDLMIGYRNLEGTLSGEEYNYRAGELGMNLRLMTPARSIRFVGVVGLGANLGFLSGTPTADFAAPHFFVNSETGIELDFGGVLVGFTGQQVLATDSSSLGAAIRIGYGAW